jgi:hypothetical protein
VGIDHTDGGDVTATPGDAAGGGGDQRGRSVGQVESRDRESYRAELHAAADPPGSWRGESHRYLDVAANGAVEARCYRIAETEERLISPGVREVEGQDAGRCLVGFEHRLKGPERIKDKVAHQLEAQAELTPDQAIATVKDAVRYTFRYEEDDYKPGVLADVARMENQGFERIELRNSWEDDQYKGINSRWREPTTGQLFEVQFHTRSSFEAKQLTHGAYERLRNPTTTPEEQRELANFQREVSAKISIPPDATEIPDYP